MINPDPYIQALFGCYAVQAPVQITVQRATEHVLSAVLVTDGDLTFGSKLTHQLIIGDAIFRPHVVLETDAFRGQGLASLSTTSIDRWKRAGKILINPAEREI